ncbi:hypothetical protein CASFOL_014002 [Castilleja foliolosa]|uniref:Transcription factor CBF/NF-Y/archaeal histone domain-containing protein n=1 Tax=Castilleja foliolosa TaxID=1961234 RepID=A0ABD3DPF8_9LAMI
MQEAQIQGKHTPKGLSIIINEGGRTSTTAADNPTNADNLNTNPQHESFKRAADQYMPVAHVVRIMRQVLPSHAKISDDAKETIQECVSEFINFVTTEANQRCHKEYRKTVSPDDVISAMGLLGFDNYVGPLTVFLDKHCAQDPARGLTHRHMPYARRGVYGPTTQMAQPPAPPGPSVTPVEHRGNYVGLPQQMGGYFMGNQSGGEDASGGAEIDPFAELFR